MDKPISFCVQLNSYEIARLTEDERQSLFALGIINGFLACPTTAINALIIIAILTTPELATPSYLLTMNLAFTDLLVGILGQPLQSAMVLFYRNNNPESYCYVRSVNSLVASTAGAVSIGTVTAIAADRYMAIKLKTQYRTVVSVRRVKSVLVFLWVLSVMLATMPYYIALTPVSILSTCLIVVCMITCVVCYVMSFKTLKKHYAQISHQGDAPVHASPSVDIEKYRTLLKTMLIVLVFILCCYSIMAVVVALFSDPHPKRSLLWGLMSILGLNSTFTPVIYMSRMKDLKHACTDILRKRCLRFQCLNHVHPLTQNCESTLPI